MKINTQNFDFKKGIGEFFPAFVGGVQTDSNGVEKEWSHAELDEIVTNTKKRINENIFSGAPFVIGHPKVDSPSYAWAADIKREGDVILVKGDKIHEEFANGVESGLWPNRSVRIGKGEDGLYLRHVGFLGATPPAIEGMDSIYSVSTEDECFDYSIDSYTPSTISRVMRRLRDFIINKFDMETADQVIPDYEIESLSDHANSLRDKDDSAPSFSKNKPTGDDDMSKFSQEELDAEVAKAKQDAREEAENEFAKEKEKSNKELKAERDKRLGNEFSATISTLIDDGKLLPAQAEGMADFMLQLSDEDDANFEFSSGEGDKKETIKKSPLKYFQDFMQSIGQQIDTSESKDDGADAVGDDPQAIANAAVEYQKSQSDKGVDVSISQAVAHVTKNQ